MCAQSWKRLDYKTMFQNIANDDFSTSRSSSAKQNIDGRGAIRLSKMTLNGDSTSHGPNRTLMWKRLSLKSRSGVHHFQTIKQKLDKCNVQTLATCPRYQRLEDKQPIQTHRFQNKTNCICN